MEATTRAVALAAARAAVRAAATMAAAKFCAALGRHSGIAPTQGVAVVVKILVTGAGAMASVELVAVAVAEERTVMAALVVAAMLVEEVVRVAARVATAEVDCEW